MGTIQIEINRTYTADDWSIYTSMEGADVVGQALTTLFNTIIADELTAMLTRQRTKKDATECAFNKLYREFEAYQNFGATDTAVREILWYYVQEEFKFDKDEDLV